MSSSSSPNYQRVLKFNQQQKLFNPTQNQGEAGQQRRTTPQAEDTSEPTLDPEVLPEERIRMPTVKSRRGRSANPVALNNQGAVDESNVEPPAVEPEPKPEAPAVRSGRSAGNKQVKPQVEDAANGPSTETSAAAAVAEEPAVKNIRGGRRTKPPKAQVLDDSQDSETIQQLEAPTARSSRGKRTAVVKDEPDVQVKRGRRGATVEAPPPIVKPSRGRKAPTKSEPEEVTEGSTSVVEPVDTSNETKVPGPATEETPLAEAKRGRGRIAKKAKVSTKDTSVKEAEEAATSVEPQQKTSRKKDEPAAKDDAETKQSVHPSVKGRKGRGAKEQEEPEKEKPAAEETIQPVRRGRAAASVGLELEVAARQKRKDLEVEGDKTSNTESLLKRKRGKGAGAEAQTDAAAAPGRGRRTAAKEAEETSVVEAEEAPKNEEKPVRGRRRAAPEDRPPQAEDPVSERTTRRGTRGEKKAETDVAPAPARRTRRK
ncbi:hypothetical protein AMELA_G00108060 [Ameiurus melas]|uniref:Uncharacterized protein n=1 Tax=Ameiurus melas TaxID=219545 RepID=A0A7J6ANY4_AMEME|nr:hypothetical protein AMELA_G00108060 [Ameiurus melas]